MVELPSNSCGTSRCPNEPSGAEKQRYSHNTRKDFCPNLLARNSSSQVSPSPSLAGLPRRRKSLTTLPGIPSISPTTGPESSRLSRLHLPRKKVVSLSVANFLRRPSAGIGQPFSYPSARTSGSLLRTRQKERDVVDFSLSCHETAVLPTWGTTELLQAQGFGQAFLDEALGGDHGGGSIRTRTLGGIQEYELLDLLQLFLQIFDGDRGPEGLGLAANVVQQGETQQAVKSVHADLAVGPVIQGLPVEPVAFLEAPENLLDRLLAGVGGHDLLGGPIEAVGDQQGAAQAMHHQFLEGGVIDLKHQASSAGFVQNLIVDQLGEEGGREPAVNLGLDPHWG